MIEFMYKILVLFEIINEILNLKIPMLVKMRCCTNVAIR